MTVAHSIPRSRGRFTLVAWIVAASFAAVGTVVAIAVASWWPLVAFLGFALPLIPVGSARGRSRR